MIQYLNVFFYDIYPYICATVFFLGSWLRYDYGQYTWRASSSQMLDKRGMVIWSNLFHIGILGISACACNFHYAGYYHHEHFADPVSAGAKYHTVFSTVS